MNLSKLPSINIQNARKEHTGLKEEWTRHGHDTEELQVLRSDSETKKKMVLNNNNNNNSISPNDVKI